MLEEAARVLLLVLGETMARPGQVFVGGEGTPNYNTLRPKPAFVLG